MIFPMSSSDQKKVVEVRFERSSCATDLSEIEGMSNVHLTADWCQPQHT